MLERMEMFSRSTFIRQDVCEDYNNLYKFGANFKHGSLFESPSKFIAFVKVI